MVHLYKNIVIKNKKGVTYKWQCQGRGLKVKARKNVTNVYVYGILRLELNNIKYRGTFSEE